MLKFFAILGIRRPRPRLLSENLQRRHIAGYKNKTINKSFTSSTARFSWIVRVIATDRLKRLVRIFQYDILLSDANFTLSMSQLKWSCENFAVKIGTGLSLVYVSVCRPLGLIVAVLSTYNVQTRNGLIMNVTTHLRTIRGQLTLSQVHTWGLATGFSDRYLSVMKKSCDRIFDSSSTNTNILNNIVNAANRQAWETLITVTFVNFCFRF